MIALACLRMQRMISTRLDETLIDALDRASRKLRIPKRQFIEEAMDARSITYGQTRGRRGG